MKTFSIKRAVMLSLVVVAFVTLSSCNRGVGCPTNFSMMNIFDTISQLDWVGIVQSVLK